MEESDFTNREIQEMFKDVDGRFDRQDVQLGKILDQTKATNGSVADINRWRERANGAFWAAGVFMATVILPIIGFVMYSIIHLDDSIQSAVDHSLSAYDIQSDKTQNQNN